MQFIYFKGQGALRLPDSPKTKNLKNMDYKETIKNYGNFNNWRGFIGLYFTKKQLREIAKLIGVKFSDIEAMTIKEVYNAI